VSVVNDSELLVIFLHQMVKILQEIFRNGIK
jgi:hypothetical protein